MSRLMLWNLAACCAVAWCGSALADRAMGDLAPFRPEPPAGRKLVVRVDPNAEVSKLILPEDLDEAPAAGNAGRPAPGDGSFWSPTRTMMAGLCLSLVVVSLFFIRTTSGGARMLLIAVAGLSAVGMGAVAWADIPSPFPRPRPGPPQPQPVPIAEAVQLAEGRVVIEYTDKKDAPVTLILSGKSVGGVFRLPPGVPAPEPRPRPNFRNQPGALPPPPGAPEAPPAPAPE